MTAQEITGQFLRLDHAIRYFAPSELMAEYDRRAALPIPEPPRRRRGGSNDIVPLSHLDALQKHQMFVDQPWEQAKHFLFALIFHKKLEAWGVMSAPEERTRLEPIPSEFFDDPREGWFKANIIKKRRYCYESVVVKIPTVQQASPCSPAAQHIGNVPQLPAPAREGVRKQGGRPALVGLVADIIEELEQQNAFEGMIKKERDDLIRKTAQARHPRNFAKATYPSPNTIDKARRMAVEKNFKNADS